MTCKGPGGSFLIGSELYFGRSKIPPARHGCCLVQTVITAKSTTARRPAPCALFPSSSPTTRATARTKATASAGRRPGAPAEVLSQRLARWPGACPREYALLQLPAGMQKLVPAACRLAHAAPGSD